MRRIVALGALLVLTGCAGGGEPTATVTVFETVEGPRATASEDPSTESSDPAETTTSEPAEEVPAGEEGSRSAPLAPGATFPVGDWMVVLRPTVLNANELVKEENQFNELPVAGRQFVMVSIFATYGGSESGSAWMDLTWKFVGSAGNTFSTGSGDSCGSIPNNLSHLGEAFKGASVEGNVCVSVPSDQVAAGLWMLEDWASFDGETTFVALA